MPHYTNKNLVELHTSVVRVTTHLSTSDKHRTSQLDEGPEIIKRIWWRVRLAIDLHTI